MQTPVRVLLIESDEAEYQVIWRTLEHADPERFEVEWISTYVAGCAALLEGTHDVCLLAYNLDGEDGIVMLRECRRQGAAMPVILLTDKVDYRLDVEAMQAGAADFLVKDQLTPALLERAIRYAVDRARGVALIRLMQEAAAAANEADTADQAIHFVVDRLRRFADWRVGHAFRVSGPSAELISTGVWSFDIEDHYNEFRRGTENRSFATNAELPGQVLSSGRHLVVEDLSTAGEFPRAHEAEVCGLTSCFMFPVLAGEQIAAVIEFFNDAPIRVDAAMLETTWFLGQQLAHVIEREKSESDLRASEIRFRSVVQSAADAVILADSAERIVSWNTSAERIFGYGQQEILGRPLEILVAERYRAVFRRDMERFRVTGKSAMVGRTVELEAVGKDGREFPMEMALASWTTTEETFFTGIIRDITERRRAEQLRLEKEAAERATRAKSDFVARISHELRTPLNAIIGFVQLLLQNKDGNLRPQDIDFLQRIHVNARDQLQLINGILDLSKVEAGKMELQISDVALGELIREVVKQMARDRTQTGVKLRMAVPEPLEPIRADAQKLKQVLLNLVDNALKFTERGAVTIQVLTQPHHRKPARIDIIDTGIGIPPERVEEIFVPFHRLEHGKGQQTRGTGLGLSICRSLCELMAFRLHVKSAPGQGSTFSIVMETDAGQLPRSA